MSQKMGLIIYVSLLLLTPKIPSLPFDPQDNSLLSWAHSYTEFHNQSNCWVCGVLPSSSVEGFPWWTSPLQGKDFLQVCKYLQQQSHVMPLLKLMTSNNPKKDCSFKSQRKAMPKNAQTTPQEGNGTPLQYSCLENPRDGGAW